MMFAASFSLKYYSCEIFSNSSPPVHSLKTFLRARINLLGDQEVALGVLEELVQLQNVRVVQLLQDRNLAEEFLLLVFLEVLFVYDLDSSECLGLLVQTLPHLSVGACPS